MYLPSAGEVNAHYPRIQSNTTVMQISIEPFCKYPNNKRR